MTEAYEEGYYAGLVYNRVCPHNPFSIAALFWHAGNYAGVRVHCAVVEAVYVNSEFD